VAIKVYSRNIHHLPKHSDDFQNLYLIYGNASRHKRYATVEMETS